MVENWLHLKTSGCFVGTYKQHRNRQPTQEIIRNAAEPKLAQTTVAVTGKDNDAWPDTTDMVA